MNCNVDSLRVGRDVDRIARAGGWINVSPCVYCRQTPLKVKSGVDVTITLSLRSVQIISINQRGKVGATSFYLYH